MNTEIQIDKQGKLGDNPFTDKFQYTIASKTLHATRIKTDWTYTIGELICLYQRFSKKEKLKRLKSFKRIHWIKNRRFFEKGRINHLRAIWKIQNLKKGIYKTVAL